MKALLLFLMLMPGICLGQHILISGTLLSSDTVRIEVFSDGRLIGEQVTTDQVYSVVLGQLPHYTIRFSSDGRAKYLHLINTGAHPEHFAVDLDFRRQEHLILFKTNENQRKAEMHTYRRAIKTSSVTF